ncbi:MAG: YceI family protein [Desulfobacterales bacterium]|nr:YceI family protein [Desulfobacterales bacterium]
MRKSFYVGFAAVAVLLFALSAHAAAPSWNVDKAHSNIYFGVQHIYSTVKGVFNDFAGDIRFDPDNLGDSRFDFTVQVESIDTNITKRDNHLLSGDFFDAGKHPEMTFKSAAIDHLGGDEYSVEGTLTVKDVSRTVTVPFTYFGTTANPFDPKQLVAGFEARMTIDRLQYHVGAGKFYDMGVVGKEVDILITIEALRDN